MLENLPAQAATEAAIAAAQLLQHAAPAAAAVLLRPGALGALLAAAADEICAAEPGSDLRARTPRAQTLGRMLCAFALAHTCQCSLCRLGGDRGPGGRTTQPAGANAGSALPSEQL